MQKETLKSKGTNQRQEIIKRQDSNIKTVNEVKVEKSEKQGGLGK